MTNSGKKRINIIQLHFWPVKLKVNINIKASQFQIRQCTAVSIIHLKHLIGIINIKGSKPDSAFNELKLMSSNVTITNGKALFRMKLKWNEIEYQELHVHEHNYDLNSNFPPFLFGLFLQN